MYVWRFVSGDACPEIFSWTFLTCLSGEVCLEMLCGYCVLEISVRRLLSRDISLNIVVWRFMSGDFVWRSCVEDLCGNSVPEILSGEICPEISVQRCLSGDFCLEVFQQRWILGDVSP